MFYIRLHLLMKGLDKPKTSRGWQNIPRISCASSWVFLNTIAQFSSPSRVVSFVYCVQGIAWSSELVCLSEMNVRQCVVCTVCLCYLVSWGSPTKWLVISSAVCLLFSNTPCDLMNNWCVILNISYLLKLYFVFMLRVWARERLPWQCDRWSTRITVVMCLTLQPIYAQNQTQVAMQKRMFGLHSWFGWCDCGVLLFFFCECILPCVLLPSEVLSDLIQAGPSFWVYVNNNNIRVHRSFLGT